jgi:hypothetical protein
MIIVDSQQLERARLELRAMVRSYLFSPDYDINLIDFGFPQRTDKQTGERRWDLDSAALRFHVIKKYTLEQLEQLKLRRLPRNIGPFQTDVIEAEYGASLPLYIPTGPRASDREKLCGGLGISALRDMYGTLGGIVRDAQSGDAMIMSNWHVLYATRSAQAGRPTYQPIMLSNGLRPSVVARITRERLATHTPGELPLDVAVARLVDQARWENLQFGVGRVTGVARARLGMKVVKSALVTGVAAGAVSGIEGFSKMTYDGNWTRLIERVVTISRWPLNLGATRVSLGGDSGAWWLDAATHEAVALHYAGKRDGTRAQAMDMQHVLDAVGVTIADGAGA